MPLSRKPKVLDDVAFAPLNFGLPDYKTRAQQALALLGLTPLQNRIIWELSGGEQHLVALAGALAMSPEIIMVDEPVAQLDPVNAETVYQNLAMLNQKFGKTIIVIEHHPDFIGAYCKSVILLRNGSVVWHLPVQEALSRVDDLRENDLFPPHVTRLAHALRTERETPHPYPIHLEDGIPYFRPFVHPSNGASVVPPVPSLPEPAKPKPDPLLEFRNVSHHYLTITNEPKPVLNQINLQIHAGDRIALVGANGAGKSTLLKMVSGLERPKEGVLFFRGQNTARLSPEKLADDIALIYQDPQQMFIEDSIERDIAYYLTERKVPGTSEIVAKALVDFRLEAIKERDGRLLSGGQMRRLSLAIGASMRPKVMLLDEPTSSLDVANRIQITEMLRKLEEWVQTVIIATHDMELVTEWANRVIVLRQGQILADAPPADIFRDQTLVQTARIRLPQVVSLSHALALFPMPLTVNGFLQFVRARRDSHV